MVLDLTKTNDHTPSELRTTLMNAISTPGSTELTYQNETIRVDLVSLEFRTDPNPSKVEYVAKVNFIETNESIEIG